MSKFSDIGRKLEDLEFKGDGITDAVNILVLALVNELDRQDLVSSGNLAQSIIGEDVANINLSKGEPVTIRINGADYANFVDQGVQGVGGKDVTPKNTTSPFRFKDDTRLFTKAIDKWKSNKGINGSSFLISRSIKRRGLRATNFISKAIDQKTLDDFSRELSDTLANDITIKLTE